jgi:hypothetical protein
MTAAMPLGVMPTMDVAKESEKSLETRRLNKRLHGIPEKKIAASRPASVGAGQTLAA